MNRSRSKSSHTFKQFTLSPKRGIYINQQSKKRETGTIFHSPFKDGKPNKQFINPTFTSSQIFYPQQSLSNHQDFIVKKGQIPNINDCKKQALYQERIKKQKKHVELLREQAKIAQEQTKSNHKVHKPFRLRDPQERLRAELQNLTNYRQITENQKKRQLSRTPKKDIPAYLQSHRANYAFENHKSQKQRTELSEYLALSNQLREMKKEIKRQQNQKENDQMEKAIFRNKSINIFKETDSKRNSDLMANILKEQIRTNELLREKQWNH